MPWLRIPVICSVRVCPSLTGWPYKDRIDSERFFNKPQKLFTSLPMKHESTKFRSRFRLCQQLRLRWHMLERAPWLPHRHRRAFFPTERCSDQESRLCQHQVQQFDWCRIKISDAVCPGETPEEASSGGKKKKGKIMHNKGAEENHRPNLNRGYLCIRSHEEGVLGPEWWMTCEEEIQTQQPGSRSEQCRAASQALRQLCLPGREILGVTAGPLRHQRPSGRLVFVPQTKPLKAGTLLSRRHRPPEAITLPLGRCSAKPAALAQTCGLSSARTRCGGTGEVCGVRQQSEHRK